MATANIAYNNRQLRQSDMSLTTYGFRLTDMYPIQLNGNAMKTTEQARIDTGQATGPAQSVNDTRRNFTKSGLIVSGVLLTLASRSALGGNFACQTPSGFLSGNVSTHGTPTTCSGKSPGYWGTHAAQWPMPYQPGSCTNSGANSSNSCTNAANWSGGTTFRSVFNCNGQGHIYTQYSMMQLFWLNGNQDPNQLGAYFVAAVLNARFGLTPVLAEPQVVNIFNEWDSKGYFEPTAGVKWYAPDLVAYLQSTMA